jgi:hypothetical protein
MMDIVDFGPATRTLAALVDGVADDQLGGPTPCSKWTRDLDGLAAAWEDGSAYEGETHARPVTMPAPAVDGHLVEGDPRGLDRLVGMAGRDPGWTAAPCS